MTKKKEDVTGLGVPVTSRARTPQKIGRNHPKRGKQGIWAPDPLGRIGRLPRSPMPRSPMPRAPMPMPAPAPVPPYGETGPFFPDIPPIYPPRTNPQVPTPAPTPAPTPTPYGPKWKGTRVRRTF